MYPNNLLYFYSEIQNFKVVLKWPFVFLQRNAKFWNCTQAAISLFLQWNTEFWKLYPNDHLFFPQGNTKSNYLSSIKFCFLKTEKSEKYDFEIFCFVFLQWKTKLQTLLNFELHFIHKRGYKNIDYRKLVTSLFNGFLKPVVYCRENCCKKVNPQFFFVLYSILRIS